MRERGFWFAAFALALLLVPGPACHACAACFGQSDGALAEGMNMGILTLLGVVVGVLGTFVVFFVSLGRRAAAAARAMEPPGANDPA
ncbi:MAG: hypothetical protein H7A45_17765 [Verrucomicrobiales bacterium]|nr:hypothetical protein [Verrucomicrobiales bacterium]MCP5525404.1 hypothetical protein [Verrucomicrobiales bacterium]